MFLLPSPWHEGLHRDPEQQTHHVRCRSACKHSVVVVLPSCTMQHTNAHTPQSRTSVIPQTNQFNQPTHPNPAHKHQHPRHRINTTTTPPVLCAAPHHTSTMQNSHRTSEAHVMGACEELITHRPWHEGLPRIDTNPPQPHCPLLASSAVGEPYCSPCKTNATYAQTNPSSTNPSITQPTHPHPLQHQHPRHRTTQQQHHRALCSTTPHINDAEQPIGSEAHDGCWFCARCLHRTHCPWH